MSRRDTCVCGHDRGWHLDETDECLDEPRVGDVITTAEQLKTLWRLEAVLIEASGHYPSGGAFDRCWARPVPASVCGIHGMWEVLVYGASMPDSLTTSERIRTATVLYVAEGGTR